MEIELFISNMKEIYPYLLTFIEDSDDTDNEFLVLVNLIAELEIVKDKDQFIGLLELISKVSVNRHRTPSFFNKLEKLFHYFFQEEKIEISFSEIIQIFEKDKRLLLLILEKNFLPPDEESIKLLMEKKDSNGFKLEHYLYGGLKAFIDEENKKRIEKEIQNNYNETIESFEEKCRIGENDSYVCSLIRHDSIEEFVSFVNRKNLTLSGQINTSIFETNSFIIENKKPTLIEYAAFFGSIEIFQYLKFNKVPLKGTLWLYTIHSNNAELIHLLEENNIKPEDDTYEECFQESIRCHYNNIADYFKDNLCDIDVEEFASYICESYNFYYLPKEINITDLISNPKDPFGFNIFLLCFSIKSITIPSSITEIGERAFEECSSLTQITIPSSVTSIGNYAFSECSSLTHITIPSSVTSIEKYVFSGCSSLASITIPPSITSIGIYAFFQCSSLKEVSLPPSITNIDMGVFSKCSKLVKIEIPQSVTSIGENAFSECSSLAQVSIPSSVTKICGCAFLKCSSLVHIVIPSFVKSIGHRAFNECSLTQITIPSSVESIGNGSFGNCISLSQVVFEEPSSLKSIGDDSFVKCSSLIQISIPPSVTSIGKGAFNECSSLKQVKISQSINTIERDTFNECSSLESISIPSSVTKIGYNAFRKCSSMSQLIFETPSKLCSIDRYAFSECSSLKIVTIPSSVRSIMVEAFIGCSNLEEISIPSTTEYYYTFSPKVKVIRT